MFDLKPLRHISTLPIATDSGPLTLRPLSGHCGSGSTGVPGRSQRDWTQMRHGRVVRVSTVMERGAGSLRLDVCGLDDRPPFTDLGLLQLGKCRRSLLLARKYLLRQSGQPRSGIGIGQSLHGGSIELGNDVLRRPCRRPETEPDTRVEPRSPALPRCAINRRAQSELRAMATYDSCGNVNLPPSSIAEVDRTAVSAATDAMIAWGSALSFRRTVIGVARS